MGNQWSFPACLFNQSFSKKIAVYTTIIIMHLIENNKYNALKKTRMESEATKR